MQHARELTSRATFVLQIRLLDSHKAVAAAGPQADCAQFVEYIQRNMALAEFKTGLKASTKSASSYIRTELSTALRRNPYQVNLLIGGWDKDTGAGLYYLDYMGSMQKMNFGAHGYAGYFIFSTMDRHWRPKMSLEEVLGLARMCIKVRAPGARPPQPPPRITTRPLPMCRRNWQRGSSSTSPASP
jgi:20S proteasome subunit beta 4